MGRLCDFRNTLDQSFTDSYPNTNTNGNSKTNLQSHSDTNLNTDSKTNLQSFSNQYPSQYYPNRHS